MPSIPYDAPGVPYDSPLYTYDGLQLAPLDDRPRTISVRQRVELRAHVAEPWSVRQLVTLRARVREDGEAL